ncbi:serine/threonine protein kinase [Erysipelothrix sp. HDW6C]|uniref:serine/threonine protein kinase n=1 Tax=Erysipelothrix sp. HDW6C TaxID=2714930 RepID=UPI00140DC9D1|nr:serine/threonine-protein kinase [Erysipelothrix sp. HDW6C]QIK70439.1 serine/threonine protein kinase [Erysipelothrix sp. HDW6C]
MSGITGILKDNQYDHVRELASKDSVNVDLVYSHEHDRLCVRKRIHKSNVDNASLAVLKTLNHPHVAKIYDYYEVEDATIFIIEYIQGQNLLDYIRTTRATDAEIANLMVQLLDAVAYLHQHTHPIIHRDIKPDNILVDESGHVTLIDLQSFRIFEHGKGQDTVYVGTIGYAAPEQFGYRQTDVRTDIYSIGMTLKTIVTDQEPSDQNLPIMSPFKNIILKATAFDPQDRYTSVLAMKTAFAPFTNTKVEKQVPKNHRLTAFKILRGFSIFFLLGTLLYFDKNSFTDALIMIVYGNYMLNILIWPPYFILGFSFVKNRETRASKILIVGTLWFFTFLFLGFLIQPLTHLASDPSLFSSKTS